MTRWLIGIGLAAALAAAPASAETVVKLGTFAPTGSTYHDILLELQRDWAEIAGGAVELRIYADGVAGDETDVVRKMRVGQLQAATLILGGLPDIDPGFRAFQMPMTYASSAEFDHVLRTMRPVLDRMLERRGFRGLGWADAGWLHIFSRRPVRTPDDLRAQRVFVWAGADRLTEALRDCGFRPIQLAATDIHTALQSRMLDAISAPPVGALSYQWFAELPHMSTLKWVPLMVGFVITEAGWRSLPPRLRPALAAAVETAAHRMSVAVRADTEKAVRVMQEHGLGVHEVSEGDAQAWRTEVARCLAPLVGDYFDARLFRQIEETLGAFRAGN
jgi:TRAP-type C4-dicarboxylate transport system substrate-binding protein